MDHARLVDVGPTIAWAAGVPAAQLVDGGGAALDGRALAEYVTPTGGPVIGLLWDGAHCGELLDLTERGELPGVSRLLERGCALRGGAVAEFPSVTLTNHTSILTGLSPGRHGVLGNMFVDRRTGLVVDTNTASAWHRTREWFRPDVRTVFEMLRDARSDTSSHCINEPIDLGAVSSTMQLVRASAADGGADGLTAALPAAVESPYLGDRANATDSYYAWCTQIDDAGVMQAIAAFAESDPAGFPQLTWWSSYVTDAGHHAGGPRSRIAVDAFRDADRRLQAFLEHLDRVGVLDEVTFVLTADHGFEGTDTSRPGDWLPALQAAGIEVTDVGPGFLYLR